MVGAGRHSTGPLCERDGCQSGIGRFIADAQLAISIVAVREQAPIGMHQQRMKLAGAQREGIQLGRCCCRCCCRWCGCRGLRCSRHGLPWIGRGCR